MSTRETNPADADTEQCLTLLIKTFLTALSFILFRGGVCHSGESISSIFSSPEGLRSILRGTSMSAPKFCDSPSNSCRDISLVGNSAMQRGKPTRDTGGPKYTHTQYIYPDPDNFPSVIKTHQQLKCHSSLNGTHTHHKETTWHATSS